MITELVRKIDVPETSVKEDPNTQRVKSVLFDRPYSANEITGVFLDSWDLSADLYEHPLAQVRAIMPVSQEEQLLEQFDRLHASFPDDDIGVVARVPFTLDGEKYGIYYCQAASLDRALWQTDPTKPHEEAVVYGESRRGRREIGNLPEGFRLFAVEFVKGRARDILHNGNELPINIDDFAGELVDLHKAAFPIPHDPNQQTVEGVKEIIVNNPTIIVCDDNGKLLSAGFLERDLRFTFGNIALVEPTYFTHPGSEYRGHGFSSHIRRATQELVRLNMAYGGSPMLVFNESIRDTSFQLCLENWCQLAGEGRISGDLGEAYTLIGSGFKPLGVTFYESPRLGSLDQHWIGE